MEAVFSLILFKIKERSGPAQVRNTEQSLICPKESSFDIFRFQRERRSGKVKLKE